MEIENIKKNIKRAYRKDKPKFYTITGAGVIFLLLIIMTLNKAGNSIDTSHGEQVVELGKTNNTATQTPKNYVSIYDLKYEPLKINSNSSAKSSTPASPNKGSETKNINANTNTNASIYKISAPLIDGLVLGKSITPEELKKLGFELGSAHNNLFSATKAGSVYNIYGIDGAVLNVLSNNSKISSLVFTWSRVEAKTLMKNIMDAHQINLSAVNCSMVSVPEESKVNAKLINTEMCTLRAVSQGLSLDVSTLPALKTGTASFNYIGS